MSTHWYIPIERCVGWFLQIVSIYAPFDLLSYDADWNIYCMYFAGNIFFYENQPTTCFRMQFYWLHPIDKWYSDNPIHLVRLLNRQSK